ncbi:MAG: DUF3445 domain-containing protein [Rhizobiaceae bacterium]
MSTMLPAHTPYDGSSRLFTIGLKPLDLAHWLEVDRHYAVYLEEKRRLLGERQADVFVEEPGTHESQREVLALIGDHLMRRADLFSSKASRQLFESVMVEASGGSNPPLLAAALLVQEDLVLMRRGNDGWRLAAASLSFPSSWTLTEKFGRPLQDIHAPVPGFGRGTRTADLIQRIFDNMKADQPVERMNWSLQADTDLYKPFSNLQRDERAVARLPRFPDADPATVFLRVERQTLRKLPVSGDILFTIRIFVDPLEVLRSHPDRAAIAASFAGQLGALDEAQLDYKGLTADRDRLVAVLRAMAA